MGASHGWEHVSRERKREIIDAIANGTATRGPVHAELDLTDRCNVACYFCNQQDLRTKEQVSLDRAKGLIDELAEGGVKSVRMSGGGDPLFHRDIHAILDHLDSRGIIIDNLTTNGVALSAEVAQRLVDRRSREVIFSLNAADPEDYHRMMKVKPALFDRVIENIRTLVALRGESPYPAVVVQFLLDRYNYDKLPQMYALARAAGADRIAVNPVLEIPRDRIDHHNLLAASEKEAVRPFLEETLRLDRDAGLLQIYFPYDEWNVMLDEVQREAGSPISKGFTTASSFKEENGQCFFAWYTMTVTGTGNVYPCCLLLNPDYEPLGNISESSVQEQWNGPGFTRMREEMRDVMLMEGQLPYHPDRFKTLKPACVEGGKCWLKNMYFRADEEFYRELGEALTVARKREIRWIGKPKQLLRAAERYSAKNPRFKRFYERFRAQSHPLRVWLHEKVGIRLFSH